MWRRERGWRSSACWRCTPSEAAAPLFLLNLRGRARNGSAGRVGVARGESAPTHGESASTHRESASTHRESASTHGESASLLSGADGAALS